LFFKLTAAMPFKDCYDLAKYLVNHQSPPPNLQSLARMASSPGAVIPQSLFQRLLQPVSKSQLKTWASCRSSASAPATQSHWSGRRQL